MKVASRKSFRVLASTKLLESDAHSPQAHRSTMCKRANRHVSEPIRYCRMDIRAGTLQSPIERDAPLPRPLRTGRGALHAHARGRAIDRGRSPTKRRAKRVRHGRTRQPTSASTRWPSERTAACSALLGPAEPARRRSRAGRHHWAPGHQTAHENHTEDATLSVAGLQSWLASTYHVLKSIAKSRLGAGEGRAQGVPR